MSIFSWRKPKKALVLAVPSMFFFTVLSNSVQAQNLTSKPPSQAADTTKKSVKTKIKPYKEVITASAISRKGLFTIHTVDDRYFFEIPFKLLQKDMMIINRLAAAPAEMRGNRSFSGYAGDEIGGSMVQFEAGPGNKLFVRQISFSEYGGDSTKPMYTSVKKNNVPAIIAAFPIAAYNTDSTALVVDVTDFLNTDNDLFNFSSPVYKMIYHVGAAQNDKSYLKYVHTFSNNVEIRSVKTYATAGNNKVNAYTMEINASIVLLPETPMKKRMYDERVGYFTTDALDFDVNPQGVKTQQYVNRWRLEPKDEDVEKYKRGELVEPKKQIVYYIDPSTPSKWVPYLIQGVKDWNSAFEKAGFKNAITAKLAPTAEEDSTFSLEDAHHSALIYKPSAVPNASGPSIADPRSGEILESHINWYHNVMSLVHDWYMIQCGAVDPKARKMEFDDELMGQLIRFISSHEVGHTLGLRHNFGSSSTVPVDSLRNKAWVEKNGHTPSIMDYARFNYVAQPEDNISEIGLFPRIGDYDNWAIQWGYRWYGDDLSTEKETAMLNTLTIEQQKNKRLWFGTEVNPLDPRSQNEDLGDNAMKAGEYGIKNLKRILPNLPEWTKTPMEGYNNLENIYRRFSAQFDRYIIHVIKNIGGIYETPKTIEQPGNVYAPVQVSLQKDAMAFLDKYVFTTPLWLYNKEIYEKTGISFTSNIIERQGGVINTLIGEYRLTRMIEAEAQYGSKNVYTIKQLLKDLDHSILKEFYINTSVDIFRRNLQKIYIDRLLAIAYPPANRLLFGASDAPNNAPGSVMKQEALPAKYSDMASVVKAELNDDLMLFEKVSAIATDSDTKDHLKDLIGRIKSAIKDTK